jgi:putative component of membrane protein insertase Oxa1/YidC/SpoIIIJ protein YidD
VTREIRIVQACNTLIQPAAFGDCLYCPSFENYGSQVMRFKTIKCVLIGYKSIKECEVACNMHLKDTVEKYEKRNFKTNGLRRLSLMFITLYSEYKVVK